MKEYFIKTIIFWATPIGLSLCLLGLFKLLLGLLGLIHLIITKLEHLIFKIQSEVERKRAIAPYAKQDKIFKPFMEINYNEETKKID